MVNKNYLVDVSEEDVREKFISFSLYTYIYKNSRTYFLW